MPLSEGEVNFLYWFMQGSIMQLETRWALREAWGLCPRHTAAWLMVEAAFRDEYLHGPAVLYDDIMQRAREAFALHGPAVRMRLAHQLAARQRCHLCALGMAPGTPGFIRGDRYIVGSNPSHWAAFAARTKPWWREAVCGVCDGSGGAVRCRPHLIEDLRHIPHLDPQPHRQLVENIAHHLSRYHDAFSWDRQGTDTLEDRAALVAAAGWTGGWTGLLALTHSDSIDPTSKEKHSP